MNTNAEVFREYDIRGIADTDFPDEVVVNLGRAMGTFYLRQQVGHISLGLDCRTHSPRIAQALQKGLLSTGIDLTHIGLASSPLLYFSVPYLKLGGGIMVTASHNPGEFNGFKLALHDGALFGNQIQEIYALTQSQDFEQGVGKLSETSLIEPYFEYVLKDFQTPMKLKVVVDSGNAMGGLQGPELYRRMGCEVISLYEELDGTFPHHHPDPTVLANLGDLQKKVIETGADVGIGFDGDADRIGVVDEKGQPLFGDMLLTLFARSVLQTHPGATIISEVKASGRFFTDVAAHGGKPLMWKTGHSLIKSKMKSTGALLAGEMSGHMFFKDRYFGFDDAMYAGARLIELLSQTQAPLSSLLSDIPPSVSTPEIRIDCPDRLKFEVVDNVTKEFQNMGLKVIDIDGARIEWGEAWGLVRASNTQPVLVFRFEAPSEQKLVEIRDLIQNTVTKFLPECKNISI